MTLCVYKEKCSIMGIGKTSFAERIIDQLNADNCKKVALVLVVGFIVYHGILHLRYGPDSCTWLLSSGRYKGDHEWQPYGCMVHKYSQTDTRRCLRYLAFWGTHNHFAFVGDSRIQQLFDYFVGLMQVKGNVDSSFSFMRKHPTNYTYVDNKLLLSVEFFWSPSLSNSMVEQFRKWQKSDKPPTVIVVGSGTWIIKNRNASELALEEYKMNLTRLVQPIDMLSERKTSVLWVLQEPVDADNLSPGYKMITNDQIDLYNKAAVEVLSRSSTKLWGSTRLVSSGDLSKDGTPSLSQTALRHDAQILLNMHCNNHMRFDDGTCCASAEPYTTLQAVTFGLLGVCVLIVTVKAVWSWMVCFTSPGSGYILLKQHQPLHEETQESNNNIHPVSAVARLGLIMAYFYLCDRTNFFMKENKYYSEWSFWLPVGYVFALGLFFTDDSRSTRVLHREQTNEWKGWMQLVILIYHITGASKVLPIYMLVRTLVSSYLFLTGYGHLCYIWQTRDTGLVRYFRVMFRLNFITVVLCLAMNRPYQFYFFVPLVSFWFTLMYFIFALPPYLTSNAQNNEAKAYEYFYIVMKIIGLLSIVTVLYMSEVFFQKIFVTRPWKALFVTTDDDIHQWWLHWKQDRYSLISGIIFGVGFFLAQRYNLLDDNNHGNLFTPGISLSTILATFIGIGSYTTFSFLCKGASDCKEIHSYVVFIPIVSFILLRNVSGALRTHHSSFFAWFGNISLELFVSQHHIWLAADKHGVLVLIPNAPVLNVILTSYIFVCTAHEIHRLTTIILPFVVPDDWKLVLRNFILFLTILIPIGIHDGMF